MPKIATPDNLNRDRLIQLRVTVEEVEDIDRRARKLGISRSDYCRLCFAKIAGQCPTCGGNVSSG
jgi:hypothetical protein